MTNCALVVFVQIVAAAGASVQIGVWEDVGWCSPSDYVVQACNAG